MRIWDRFEIDKVINGEWILGIEILQLQCLAFYILPNTAREKLHEGEGVRKHGERVTLTDVDLIQCSMTFRAVHAARSHRVPNIAFFSSSAGTCLALVGGRMLMQSLSHKDGQINSV